MEINTVQSFEGQDLFLHNICVTRGDILEPEDDPTDAAADDEPTLPEDREGLQERTGAQNKLWLLMLLVTSVLLSFISNASY